LRIGSRSGKTFQFETREKVQETKQNQNGKKISMELLSKVEIEKHFCKDKSVKDLKLRNPTVQSTRADNSHGNQLPAHKLAKMTINKM
jgi:hypothetical protein